MLKTRVRTAAKNKLGKDVFKFMSNSVFEKTMKIIRNHKHIELVTSREKYGKYLMKLNFKEGYPFSKELFAVEIGKTETKMNKPAYQVILDLII